MTHPSPAPQYPRTYRVALAARRWMKGIAIVLVGIAILGTSLQLAGATHRRESGDSLILADVVLFAAAANAWIRASRRVILFDDCIEVVNWRSTRSLARNEIEARRIARAGRGGTNWFHVLIPTDRKQRELKLPTALATDEAFAAWVKPIPLIRRR